MFRDITFERTQRERGGDSTVSIRSMSYNIPGHGSRLKALRIRIHRAMGPMRRSENSFTCICAICANYRKTNTVGPEYKNE